MGGLTERQQNQVDRRWKDNQRKRKAKQTAVTANASPNHGGVPALHRWDARSRREVGRILTELINDAKGNAPPAQVVAARSALLDRLWPKDWSHRLTQRLEVSTETLGDIRHSIAGAIVAVAEQRVSLAEGERMVALLTKLADLDAALELEKLRAELDEVRRIAEGGRGKLIEGEVVPVWGRMRSEAADDVSEAEA